MSTYVIFNLKELRSLSFVTGNVCLDAFYEIFSHAYRELISSKFGHLLSSVSPKSCLYYIMLSLYIMYK